MRRLSTNTPLQALVTLNDPVYIEAARALGKLSLEKSGGDPAAAIRHAVLRVTGCPPAEADLRELLALHADSVATYRTDAALLTASGEASPEAAAMSNVAAVILNLDQAMSK